MDLALVDMTAAHLRQVMRIDGQVYSRCWSRRLWLAELERTRRSYRVALAGRAVVGYVGAMFVLEDVHIMTIATSPDHQRTGIATRLMLDVLHRARDHGCSAVTLEVRESNAGAQALYRRFGLTIAGVRRGYYEPDSEDAIVMWAHHIDGAEYAQRLALISRDVEMAA